MEKFEYQRKTRRASEEKIISGLGEGRNTFMELLRTTKLSKSVLSDHLQRLEKEGIIEKFKPSKGKRDRYRFAVGRLGYGHVQRTLFSYLSTRVFDDLYEATEKESLPSKKFIQSYSRKIGVVAMYTLLTGLEIAREDPEESGRWFEDAFGSLIQKYAWRRIFYRQIFRGPYDLKHPVDLREPIKPEVKGELVILPEAFEPGLTGRIHRELPSIPKNRIRQFKDALREVCPEETKILDHALIYVTGKGKGGES